MGESDLWPGKAHKERGGGAVYVWSDQEGVITSRMQSFRGWVAVPCRVYWRVHRRKRGSEGGTVVVAELRC